MSRRKLLPRLLIAVFAITIGLILGFVGFTKTRQTQQKPVTTAPPTYSKVNSIQVVGVKVIDEGTPAARVAVEVMNNSNKAVMAVDLVCGEGAITKNGLTDEENPIVVIPAFGTTTIEMSFGAMTPEAPLVISAVTYADGSEEGDEKSLRAMHLAREHDRQMMKEIRARQKEARKP
jgi:hypothetical protein